LLESDPDNPTTGATANAVQDLIESIQTRLIVISPERIHAIKNATLTVSVPQLTPSEQLAIWQQNLGQAAE
jgi:hypothetical protein